MNPNYFKFGANVIQGVFQTVVGRSVFCFCEHAAAAAVLTSSSVLLNSSFVPNALKILPVEEDSLLIVNTVLLHSTTRQFTHTLEMRKVAASILQNLIPTTYFSRSLTDLELNHVSRADVAMCTPLVALKKFSIWNCDPDIGLGLGDVLKNFAALERFDLINILTAKKKKPVLYKELFESLGELEHLERLTNLTLSLPEDGTGFDHVGFRHHICQRVLAKDRLKVLCVEGLLDSEDIDALRALPMMNLEELHRTGATADGSAVAFPALTFLTTSQHTSDDHLLVVGNTSLQLRDLVIESSGVSGSFLAKKASPQLLVESAFHYLTALILDYVTAFSDACVETGFSRLHSLEKLSFNANRKFDGSSLKFLEGKYLKELLIPNCPLVGDGIFAEVGRFTELRKLELALLPKLTGSVTNEATDEEENLFLHLENLKKLESADFMYNDQLDPNLFVEVSPFLQNLQNLWFDGCQYLGFEPAWKMLQNCPKLESFQLVAGNELRPVGRQSVCRVAPDPLVAVFLHSKFPKCNISGRFLADREVQWYEKFGIEVPTQREEEEEEQAEEGDDDE